MCTNQRNVGIKSRSLSYAASVSITVSCSRDWNSLRRTLRESSFEEVWTDCGVELLIVNDFWSSLDGGLWTAVFREAGSVFRAGDEECELPEMKGLLFKEVNLVVGTGASRSSSESDNSAKLSTFGLDARPGRRGILSWDDACAWLICCLCWDAGLWNPAAARVATPHCNFDKDAAFRRGLSIKPRSVVLK
jgi:hypothetical protein